MPYILSKSDFADSNDLLSSLESVCEKKYCNSSYFYFILKDCREHILDVKMISIKEALSYSRFKMMPQTISIDIEDALGIYIKMPKFLVFFPIGYKTTEILHEIEFCCAAYIEYNDIDNFIEYS